VPNIIKLFTVIILADSGPIIIKLFTVVILTSPQILDLAGKDKHSGLLHKFVNYDQKSFITLVPGLGLTFRTGDWPKVTYNADELSFLSLSHSDGRLIRRSGRTVEKPGVLEGTSDSDS